MGSIRTSNSVMHNPTRLLPHKVINPDLGVVPGNIAAIRTLGASSCFININDAMGVGGADCTVTVCPDTACTLTCWIWNKPFRRWVLNGANETRYRLDFEAFGTDTFEIDTGVPFLLTSSVPVKNCSTDSSEYKPG